MDMERKIRDIQSRLSLQGLRPDEVMRLEKQLKAWGVKPKRKKPQTVEATSIVETVEAEQETPEPYKRKSKR